MNGTTRSRTRRRPQLEAIVAATDSSPAAAAALARAARSGIAHALLGSVAEWSIRASSCDVAVARPARFLFELP